MTFSFIKWTVALAATISLAACMATRPVVQPDARDAHWAAERWPGTSIADLQKGHDVFVSRCGGCHALPAATVKTADQWPRVMDEMGARAKLSTDDRELVARYLATASERLRSSGG